MVEFGREYVLCNRVFSDVKQVNRLVRAVYASLGVESFSKVRKGLLRKPKSFRVVITGRAFSENAGEIVVAVVDDSGNYRHYRRVLLTASAPDSLRVVRRVVKALSEGAG